MFAICYFMFSCSSLGDNLDMCIYACTRTHARMCAHMYTPTRKNVKLIMGSL